MKAITIAALVLITLSGCATTSTTSQQSENLAQDSMQQNTSKLIAGIPFFLSVNGSAAQLTDEWVVTVAHNKTLFKLTGRDSKVIYHPECDIALYKGSVGKPVGVAVPQIGDQLQHYGYPGSGIMQSSAKGTMLGYMHITGKWENCSVMASTAKIYGGMSGGGVYNTEGKLVGVNGGYVPSYKLVEWPNGTSYKGPSYVIDLTHSKILPWIEKTIGHKLYMFNEYD